MRHRQGGGCVRFVEPGRADVDLQAELAHGARLEPERGPEGRRAPLAASSRFWERCPVRPPSPMFLTGRPVRQLRWRPRDQNSWVPELFVPVADWRHTWRRRPSTFGPTARALRLRAVRLEGRPGRWRCAGCTRVLRSGCRRRRRNKEGGLHWRQLQIQIGRRVRDRSNRVLIGRAMYRKPRLAASAMNVGGTSDDSRRSRMVR